MYVNLALSYKKFILQVRVQKTCFILFIYFFRHLIPLHENDLRFAVCKIKQAILQERFPGYIF